MSRSAGTPQRNQSSGYEWFAHLGLWLTRTCPCVEPPGHRCMNRYFFEGANWYGVCESVSSLNTDNLEPHQYGGQQQPKQQQRRRGGGDDDDDGDRKGKKQAQPRRIEGSRSSPARDEYMTTAPMTTGITPSSFSPYDSAAAAANSGGGGYDYGYGTFAAANGMPTRNFATSEASRSSSSRAGTVAGPSGTNRGDTPTLLSPSSSSTASSSRKGRYDDEEYYYTDDGASGYSGGGSSSGHGYGGSSYW